MSHYENGSMFAQFNAYSNTIDKSQLIVQYVAIPHSGFNKASAGAVFLSTMQACVFSLFLCVDWPELLVLVRVFNMHTERCSKL